jgi:hypothetical protein
MITVIVVPETAEFSMDVSHGDVLYINQNIGVPQLKNHNALYAAPFWLNQQNQGVERVYHIIRHGRHKDGHYEIFLGNSFLLNRELPWNNMGNHRKFEYHALADFGMMELMPGYLIPMNENDRWRHGVR